MTIPPEQDEGWESTQARVRDVPARLWDVRDGPRRRKTPFRRSPKRGRSPPYRASTTRRRATRRCRRSRLSPAVSRASRRPPFARALGRSPTTGSDGAHRGGSSARRVREARTLAQCRAPTSPDVVPRRTVGCSVVPPHVRARPCPTRRARCPVRNVSPLPTAGGGGFGPWRPFRREADRPEETPPAPREPAAWHDVWQATMPDPYRQP